MILQNNLVTSEAGFSEKVFETVGPEHIRSDPDF